MVGMRKTRLLTPVVLAGIAVAIAGCGSGSGGQATPEPPANLLASVDPCQSLGAPELQAQGAAPGEPTEGGVGETACDFSGDAFDITVLKGDQQSMAYWDGQRSNMGVFEQNKVGQSDGVKMISRSGVGQGVCSQAIVVGQGSVSVQVTYDSDKNPGDEATCAKAMEIAQAVEPKLPK